MSKSETRLKELPARGAAILLAAQLLRVYTTAASTRRQVESFLKANPNMEEAAAVCQDVVRLFLEVETEDDGTPDCRADFEAWDKRVENLVGLSVVAQVKAICLLISNHRDDEVTPSLSRRPI
jgi:hypothetical protein